MKKCSTSVLSILLAMSIVLTPVSAVYAEADTDLDLAQQDCSEALCDSSSVEGESENLLTPTDSDVLADESEFSVQDEKVSQEDAVLSETQSVDEELSVEIIEEKTETECSDETETLVENQQTIAEPAVVATKVVGDKLKDGSYSIKAWSFKKATGTSRRTFTMNDTLVVRDGIGYVTITVDSTSYTYVVVNGNQYAVTVNGNASTFELPIELNKDITVSLYSSSMGTQIDYIMNVNADVPLVEEPKEPVIPSDGVYTVDAETNAAMFKIVSAQLTVKDGKMTALITLSGTGYDYLYSGTSDEAIVADVTTWIASVGNVEYDNAGTTKTGAQFVIPVYSLNQDLSFASRSAQNGTWFDRNISFASASLEEVEAPETTWQDGSYTGTGRVTPENNYPSEEYDVDVTVKIEEGKIVDVKYAEEFTYDNGNFSYMTWAMNGHHIDTSEKEGGAYRYAEGNAKQIIDAQSADNVDAVSGATWTSRAIKDAVQAALVKAEKGEKDPESTPTVKPEKETKTPDKEGIYTVDAVSYGFSLVDTHDVQLTYKNGKMTALFTTTMSPSSYDYVYMGTDDEAYAAGRDAWLKPVAAVEYVNSSGKTKTGNQYEISVESLDQEIEFIAHARSSGNWFYRAIKFDSASLKEVEAPKPVWQDGYYIGTGNVTRTDGSYFKNDYEIKVAVEIKDGKIFNVEYAEEIAPENGNISYMKWAMEGCHVYQNGTCTYLTGVAAQVKSANSAEKIDVVSGATRVSLGIQEGVQGALKKAETGETDERVTVPVEPETEDKIAEEGVYTVDTIYTGVTVIDAELTSKDGKMTALITLSGTGYDYLYFGSEDEAHDAGEDAWYGIVGTKEYVNASGKTKTGAQYNIPVESLDKQIKFLSHAKSTGKWFHRAISFDSASLKEVDVPGQDTPDQDVPGQDTPDQDTPGQDTPDQDTPGQDTPGQDTPGQDTSGQNGTDKKEPARDAAVRTGDTEESVYVWTMLCILSAVCVIGLFLNRKYNNT